MFTHVHTGTSFDWAKLGNRLKRRNFAMPLRSSVVRILVPLYRVSGSHVPNLEFDWIERIWGGQAISRRPREPEMSRSSDRPPISRSVRPEDVPVNPPPGDRSNGEFWWKRAVEKHAGAAGAVSQTIPWEALCTHSLAEYFVQVLGEEGRSRSLQVRIAATV